MVIRIIGFRLDRLSYEASIHPQIRDKVNNVSNGFYFHLGLPFVFGLISSSLFSVIMMEKLVGWLRKKSSRKILWKGDLWKKKELSSILATLTTLGIFSGLLWEWIGSFRGLPEIYPSVFLHSIQEILNIASVGCFCKGSSPCSTQPSTQVWQDSMF